MTHESDQKSENKISKRIDAYCLFHLDRFIRVVSIESWNQSVTLVELVTGQKSFCVSKEGDCVREELADGLRSAVRSGVAIEFLKTGNKTARSLCQAGTWLESGTRRFCLKNCGESVGCEANFVRSQDDGVCLLCVNSVRDDDTEVDLVVVVDAGKKVV